MVPSLFFPFSYHPAAGSGNVLKVQQLLHICSEHFDSKEKEEDKDKKEKKDKDKKEAPADMGAHQVLWVAGNSQGGSEGREVCRGAGGAGLGLVLNPSGYCCVLK